MTDEQARERACAAVCPNSTPTSRASCQFNQGSPYHHCHLADKLAPALQSAAREAALEERKACAEMARTWGNAPPNPDGRRARLAAAILNRGRSQGRDTGGEP